MSSTAWIPSYQRAYSMISSDKARAAFSIKENRTNCAMLIGRLTRRCQRMLLARRVPWLKPGCELSRSVTAAGITHRNIKKRHGWPCCLFSTQAFAALINDLDTRGLLATTLVMVTTRVWPFAPNQRHCRTRSLAKVFSIVLAVVVARSAAWCTVLRDATGSEPENTPLAVEDSLPALHSTGIDPDKRVIVRRGNRPVRIVYGGKVAKDLLA